MKKRVLALFAALLLCAALLAPALAVTYPAGIDESLPRVDDGAGLLTQAQADALDTRARETALLLRMDIVIVTRRGLGGKTPMEYADDYFDYGGYGWREAEEAGDITAGSGILLLLNMVGPGNNDIQISTKGLGEYVFRDGVWERLIDAIKPELIEKQYGAALSRFLDEVEMCLVDYADGVGIYANPDTTYNQGHYDESGNYVYDDGNESGASRGVPFSGGIFFVSLIIALIAALGVVSSMKKKHNTIRIAAAAQNYQQRFDLTERQDVFLYSNTTHTRIPDDPPAGSSSGGGSSFSGGGSHTSSSGSSHGGGGSKF